MKRISICVLFLCVGVLAFGQEQPELWGKDYRVSLEQARRENKKLLISFAGSDWCKPCIMLTREVFETEIFRQYAEDELILVLADFPRLKKNRLPENQMSHNNALAAKFNPSGLFPLVVLIDAAENILVETGYKPGGAEVFISQLKRG